MSAILSFDGLTGGYGKMQVLHDLTGDFAAGSVTSVLGANGVGKSTLMRMLAGQLTPAAGTIRYEGSPVEHLPAHSRVDAGIAMVPEGRMIFPVMTVEENLLIGATVPHARKEKTRTLAEMYELFPRLAERRSQLGGTLSGGEQQMLAIGRALMARPRLVLLDEPTLGLAPVIAKQIFALVGQLQARGLTVVMAEQDVSRSLDVADRAMVLVNGALVMNDTAAAVGANAELRRAIVG